MNKQATYFSADEMDLIKNSWKDNTVILNALFKFMLQFETSKEENLALKTIKDTPKILQVIKKVFLPNLDILDVPVNQVLDLWMTIDLMNKTPEDALNHIRARGILIEYIGQRLSELGGEEVKDKIILEDIFIKSGKPQDIFVGIIARNSIIAHTKQQIAKLELWAGQGAETLEETMEKLQKNSAR